MSPAATGEYRDAGCGWALQDTTSFVKVIADPASRLLLGAHIMGPQASTIIQPVIQAMCLRNTADDSRYQCAQCIHCKVACHPGASRLSVLCHSCEANGADREKVAHRGKRGRALAVLKLSPQVLRNLDFGAPAAERDIGRGLDKYFVESAAFDRVRSGAKTVILGNRGSGKSAIFKVMAARERAAGSHVIELAPEDYSYELLSSTMAAADAGSWAKHGAYAAGWKYLIYVLIMKEVAARGGKGAAAVIARYIRDNHPDPHARALTLLVSYLKRLEGIKIGPLEAGFKSRELDKLYKLEEIHRLLPQLTEILTRRRVVVLVDELDRGWDSSEDAKAFVSGLFQACVSMNEVHPNLRVYVSLRQELYDEIPALYEDVQKYRDLLETINWTDDLLLKLIAKRIRHCAAESGHDPQALAQASDITCWNSVFATPAGQPVGSSFRYMIDRTLHRPREIIFFCAQTVEKARERALSLPLPYGAISWTERGYSAERAQDIAAEYRFQYAGLLGVFDAFRRRPETLDRDDLEFLCLELATGDIPTAGTGTWLADRDPRNVIETLWHVGFLTAQAATQIRPPRHNGAPFLGAHQMQHPNLDAVQHFQVHPMFRSYLDIAPGVRAGRQRTVPTRGSP